MLLINMYTSQLHIVSPQLLAYLGNGYQFGHDIIGAAGGLETSKVGQFGMAVIERFCASPSWRNDITRLIGLTRAAINQPIAINLSTLVPEIQIRAQLVEHCCLVIENDPLIVGKTVQIPQTDVGNLFKNISHTNDRAHFPIENRDSFHCRIAFQREGGGVQGR